MEDSQLIQGLIAKYRKARSDKEKFKEILDAARKAVNDATERMESFAHTLRLLGADPEQESTLFIEESANQADQPVGPPVQVISQEDAEDEQEQPAAPINKTLLVLDVLRQSNGTGLEPKDIYELIRQRGMMDFSKDYVYPVLSKQLKAGKIQVENGRYRLTDKGRAVFESQEG